ncbi:DUF4214 domain-containing protein [Devosia sp. SD17-2]|uniref:DUF4214 domain-containing protein n=1 Tax=Devosia sp. SD17-2 TaxID=2976459 RepID=UPI0023D897E6|nr:DUF4214 domain-containing protein [Devosia sp. SD17-2]WEJ32506.1 DUF4214 domain-containing protein [Devosia sp. SD17-2]
MNGIKYNDPNYFRPLTTSERTMFREAIKAWEDISGIVFFEVPGGMGDVEAGGYQLAGTTAGQASMPGSGVYIRDGKPTLFSPSTGYDGVFLDQKTGMNLHVMLHEIGHALGMEHPHDGTEPLLNPSKDNGANTVMTYNDYDDHLGVMDLQAIQAMYGTPAQKGTQIAGWNWDQASLTLTQQGTGAAEIIHGTNAHDIVHAGGGRDLVVTRGGNDVVYVKGQHFEINAGTGFDIVVTDFSRSVLWDVSHDREMVHMITHASNSWDMIVKQAERINFTDAVLAFDFEGNAGQAYRLYQAAFNRTPDEDGLGFWIRALDQGQGNVYWAASNFIGSNEFASLYGTPASVSDEAFIGLLYQNVLKRGADASGFAFWIEEGLNKGMTRDAVLVNFSDSPENKANVAGQIADGIWFT